MTMPPAPLVVMDLKGMHLEYLDNHKIMILCFNNPHTEENYSQYKGEAYNVLSISALCTFVMCIGWALIRDKHVHM